MAGYVIRVSFDEHAGNFTADIAVIRSVLEVSHRTNKICEPEPGLDQG